MITSMSGTQQQSEHQAGLFAPALPPRAEMERAFFASDPSYDGLFVTGVRTTGIFCRPVGGEAPPMDDSDAVPVGVGADGDSEPAAATKPGTALYLF